jgi:hypothetical protein
MWKWASLTGMGLSISEGNGNESMIGMKRMEKDSRRRDLLVFERRIESRIALKEK